jgi:hypothetical protein
MGLPCLLGVWSCPPSVVPRSLLATDCATCVYIYSLLLPHFYYFPWVLPTRHASVCPASLPESLSPPLAPSQAKRRPPGKMERQLADTWAPCAPHLDSDESAAGGTRVS